MSMFFGMLGMIGFFVCLIGLVVKIVKKKKKKGMALGMLAFFICFIIGMSLPGSNSEASSNSGSDAPATEQATSEVDENEQKAQKLKDDAQSNFEDGKYEAAFSKCDKIIADYPDTEVAASIPDFRSELYDSAINISATDLYKAYDANEVNADNIYKDKAIILTGKISDIGKDILNNTYITLDDGSTYNLTSVQCYFDDDQSDSVAKLAKGDSIKLIGVCDGKSINVLIKNSVIIG